MRKLLVGAAIVGLSVLPAANAFAAGPYTQPGYDHAINNTDCADHGSFGYFGAQGAVHDLGVNNLGSNGRPGASNWQFPSTSGGTTAGNNSSLCGNGAAPAPFVP